MRLAHRLREEVDHIDAIRKANLEAEEERTRRAYLQRPDSDAESDDWSNAGK